LYGTSPDRLPLATGVPESVLAVNVTLLLIALSTIGQHDPGVQLIAHRGGVVDEVRIEHSLPAIEEAIRRGYWMLEVDVRRSRDGRPIVHHDENFQRYFHEPLAVADLTWQEIKSLRSHPGGLQPLDFAEVAAACRGKTRLMLDVKVEDNDPQFYAAVERTLIENNLLESAYLIGSDAAEQHLGHRLKTSTNGPSLRAAIARGEEVGSKYFLFGVAAGIDQATVQLAQQHHVDVVPAVNTFRYSGANPRQQAAEDIKRLRALGVARFQIDSVYESLFELPAQPSSDPNNGAPEHAFDRAMIEPVFPSGEFVSSDDGMLPNAPVLIKSLGDAAEFVTRWQPPTEAAAWNSRRIEVARAFSRALGLDPLPIRTPLNARKVAQHEMDGYAIENIVFESRPSFIVTANVYRPNDGAPIRRAAVLCPVGHYLSAGKTATDVQMRCIQLAKMGFVVLVYDAIGQGERMLTGNIHHEAGYALLPLGETIAGWMVWDSMRAIDYLVSRDDVDPKRIGMTGNSGGGLNTLFTAALDDRVQAAVVVGFTFEWNNWLKYGGSHCTCTHVPGLFRSMGWFEIAGLIAPRGLLMLHGQNDRIFPINGARRSGSQTKSVYQLLGRHDRVRFVELAHQPHAYSHPYREPMYGWMAWYLLGQGTGEPIEEDRFEPLAEKDPHLLCDPHRHLSSAMQTVTGLAASKAHQLVSTRPPLADAKSRDETRIWVRQLVAPATTPPCYLAAKTERAAELAVGRLETLSFFSEDGLAIPGWLCLPEGNQRSAKAVILVSGDGKSHVAQSGLVEPLVRAGFVVLSVDLRGRGETLDRFQPRWTINFRLVANQVLFGEPLAGRRAFDLMRTVDYLRSRDDIAPSEISLVGLGDDALPALLATAADHRIERVAVAGFFHSFVSQLRARSPDPGDEMADQWNDPQLTGRIDTEHYEIDFASVIPGVLLQADVPDFAALIAPRRVLFCAARDAHVSEYHWLHARFQQVARQAPHGCIRYIPEQPLEAGLLVSWLQE
jgi:glycerophosphoryl diester phosphodiesterase/cephalosporin-C deacetylase-like acetyl esterase